MKKKAFADILAEKLNNLEVGEIVIDEADGWLHLKVGDTLLEFGFDETGENLDTVGLYKENDYECEKIWAVFKPELIKDKPKVSYAHTSTQVYL